MHVFVLTIGNSYAGSTKYRIKQYEPFLKEQGVTVDCIDLKNFHLSNLHRIANADLVINQKCLIPIQIAKKIRAASRRLLFDFDDAIYTRPGKPYSWLTKWRVKRRLNFWLRHSDGIMTANHYLGQYAKAIARQVDILPMALDLSLWKPIEKKTSEKIFLGWAGAPVNLVHLERIEPVLTSLLKAYPQVVLKVYSGQRPRLSCDYEFVPFKEGTEQAFVQQLDIGLLPLPEEEFSKGKSPIKALQYLACEVPVIGNVYGATSEILNASNSLSVTTPEEWKNALQQCILDRNLSQRLGKAGRMWVERHHNLKHVQKQLCRILTRP